MSNTVDPHVEANLEVIREYLHSQFKGFELTEKPDRSTFIHVYRDEIVRRTIPIKGFLATAFRSEQHP